MSESPNIKTVQEMYAAFGRGDVASIVNHLTDDVGWMSHMERQVPWAGDFSGKQRVPQFFEALFKNVDTEIFEPKDWVAQDDTVVSTGVYGCRVHQTGKQARSEWVFIWKFRGGKVCSFEQFIGPEIAAAFR